MILSSALLAALSILPPSGTTSEDADWPHLRGPLCDGRTAAAGLFEGGAFGLEVNWKAALGFAYSGVAVSGRHLVTFFSDGESDVVIALDALDGSELWRHAVSETYRGHDGSEDGPISTPSIHGGVVFALGPLGDLVALNLADGDAIWSKHLARDFGATIPEYGCTTTPLAVDGVLIVQTGGDEGRSITGLDPASGEVLWSLGDEMTQYQSPVAMELAGRLQVIVPDGERMIGLAPRDGSLLWEHIFQGERDSVGTGMATGIDGNRFAMNVGGALTMIEVTQDAEGTGFATQELFRSRDLGRGYVAPVAYEGHIYGINNSFLTCIDGTTGKRVWKSRPPGGCGLLLVNDRLLVLGAEGVVAVVKATPDGYEEEARTQVLEHTGFAWPSFANGRLYVRNSAEVASVAIVSASTNAPIASAGTPQTGAGAFAQFVQRASASEDPQAVIEAFMEAQEQFPILEDGQMHIVYRGDVQEVAVAGTMIDGGRPRSMERIPNTDFHHVSFAIDAGTRWEYRFQIDLEKWETDPLNPRTLPGSRGDMLSEVLTPAYEENTDYREPTGPARGRIEAHDFVSEQLGDTRPLQVYLPAGYDESDTTYPLLIVHRGKDWLEKGLMGNTLDNLIGESVTPLVVAFIDPAPQWWFEGGGSGTEAYAKMLVEEFLPHLRERYRLSDAGDQNALMGAQSFGLTVALAAVTYPDVFGKVAVESLAMRDVARHALLERIEDGPVLNVDFYVGWNRYGSRNADQGYDNGADSARFASVLEAKGYQVGGGEVLDSSGWGSARARSSDILEALFPIGD
ncbi:MAG: outer membrane protein assembly factor BamB [Chlamydiales bacterium]|jgi:outer membrane protein assembly factor BamB